MSLRPMLLRAAERNHFLGVIERLGLNPIDFEWQEARGGNETRPTTVSKLVHRTTEFYFLFDVFVFSSGEVEHHLTCCPGAANYTDDYRLRDARYHVSGAEDWLERVAEELNTPDLWAPYEMVGRRLAEYLDDPSVPDTPFSEVEQANLSVALSDAREILIESARGGGSIDDGLERRIMERFDHLIESSKKMGRKDFVMLFCGYVVSLTTSVPPGALATAFSIVAKFFGFGGAISEKIIG